MKTTFSISHCLSATSLLVHLMLTSGCASNPIAPQPDRPVEIRGIDLRPAVPGAVLEVLANGPLSWTAVSDIDGSLLLDLDDSVVLPGLGDLEFDSGLVESVRIEAVDGYRPATRLVVKTRERIDFAPNILGSSFQMRLLPLGRENQGVLAVEPILVDEFGQAADSPLNSPNPKSRVILAENDGLEEADEVAAVPAIDLIPQKSPDENSAGDDQDVQDVSPDENAEILPLLATELATRLLAVSVEESGTIVLESNGRMLYQTFWLENPLRFVIDLPGVQMQMSAAEIGSTRWPLQRVRIGQFLEEPEPVARVVLDLAERVRPEIEAGIDGLRVKLPGEGAIEERE